MGLISINKKNKKKVLGSIPLFSSPDALIAILDYQSGSEQINEILNGKTLKEFDAKIHLKAYPLGVEIDLAKLWESFSFGVASDNIRSIQVKIENPLEIEINLVNEILHFIAPENALLEVLQFFMRAYPKRVFLKGSITNKLVNRYPFLEEKKYKELFQFSPNEAEYENIKKSKKRRLSHIDKELIYQEAKKVLFQGVIEGESMEEIASRYETFSIDIINRFLNDYFEKYLGEEFYKSLDTNDVAVLNEKFKYIEKLSKSFGGYHFTTDDEIERIDVTSNVLDIWPDMLILDENNQNDPKKTKIGLLIITTRYLFWLDYGADLEMLTWTRVFGKASGKLIDKIPYSSFVTLPIYLIQKGIEYLKSRDYQKNQDLIETALKTSKENDSQVAIKITDIQKLEYPSDHKLWRKQNHMTISLTDNTTVLLASYAQAIDGRSIGERYNFSEYIAQDILRLSLLNGKVLKPLRAGFIKEYKRD